MFNFFRKRKKKISGNAGFDPLGRAVFSAHQLVSAFNILRADRVLSTLEAFEPYDELAKDKSSFFNEMELPEAVIFISHRWENKINPDPENEKFEALKNFLGMIQEIAEWKRESSALQPEQIVLKHGKYQAAYFLGGYNRFDPDNSKASLLSDVAGKTISKIGIWFDFSCLSQAPDTLMARKASLARLHDLLGAANLVSFRKSGDKFEHRAWCAAELSTDPEIARSRVRKICLRVDKLNESLSLNDLVSPASTNKGFTALLSTQLEHAEHGRDLAKAVSFFQGIVGVEAEDNRETPLLFNRRPPYIFMAQEEFFAFVQSALTHVTQNPDQTVDILQVATLAASKAGLETTKPEDLAYTSLMILYARHRGAPDMARLYGQALSRHLEGRSTELAHLALRYDSTPGSDWKIFKGRCEFAFID